MSGSRRPFRLAIVNDYELVVVGVAALLEPFAERVVVVEIDSGAPVVSDVDIILYDTFGQVQGSEIAVERLTRHGDAKIVVFSWNLERDLIRASIERGASGYLSKGMAVKDLVDALEQIALGRVVVPAVEEPAVRSPSSAWPGRDQGLTARESEIVALITQGLSNQEIATRSYLSINSVKTYIRTAYRKMGVSRRSQAVLWGIEHGFRPEVTRRIRSGT